MGYFVKFLPQRKTGPQWKVQFISYKKADIRPECRAQKPKREWDINKERWHSLGFSPSMTLQEARGRAKQLNAQHVLRKQEEQIRKIEEARSNFQTRHDAALPSEFVAEFESRFVRKRQNPNEAGRRTTARAFVTWHAAQRMITHVATDPSDWFYHTEKIYDYFFNQKMSIKYAQAVLRMANVWGFFISRKMARPFLPVPHPRGYERQRIIDAHFSKKGSPGASKPITQKRLSELWKVINRRNHNWLKISIWFGLRPKEIDSLKDKQFWKLEVTPTGRKVFWVYQTKIVTLPPEDRWKPIPIIFEEQEAALKVIESGSFQRPLTQTMRRHFGRGTTLYAGRKGFTDLMLANGQTLENISIWMGHSSIQRTWSNYKIRRRFHLNGF